jgi:hypothetical protein
MYRIAFLAMLGTVACGENPAPPPPKPPAPRGKNGLTPGAEFLKLFTKHEYRKAEGWIAEESKDYYYGGTKPDVRKFEVLGVEFSDNFTHAKAMVRCTEPVVVAGFPPGDMTVNIPTLWKLENGNWYLYEDPDKVSNPSGLRTKIQAAVDGAVAGSTPPPDAVLKDLPKDPAFAMGKLQVDKPSVILSAGAEQKIVIANGLPGPISLELGAPLRGIEAKLDRADVARGEKATLTLKADQHPGAGTYYLRVMPTGEALSVQVQVK